jgi:hypothetical protein
MPTKTTKQPDALHKPYGNSEMDWAAQLDPAYVATRAEVRCLRGTLGQRPRNR